MVAATGLETRVTDGIVDAPEAAPNGDHARFDSGIGTVYRVLGELVARYELEDAAVVVDVPGLGRQVLCAGRRPLRNDERGLLKSPPGLYVEPPLDDPLLSELVVTVAHLGLRYDARDLGESEAP
jgi:hypothetical protein